MVTGRGWRLERQVRTVDTVGRPVDATVGITRDGAGRLVVAMALADGPTAVLPDAELAELVANLRQAQADVLRLDRRGGVS